MKFSVLVFFFEEVILVMILFTALANKNDYRRNSIETFVKKSSSQYSPKYFIHQLKKLQIGFGNWLKSFKPFF